MWFGTTSGLNRYNGYDFKVFKHHANNPSSLINNYILHLYEGPDNKMWVYTHNAINIYDPDHESFSSNITAELQHYHVFTDQLTSIKKDDLGNFWFTTNNKGLYFYNPVNKNTSFYSASVKSKLALHSNNISEVLGGSNNLVWIIYTDGVIDKVNTHTNKVLFRTYTLFKANNGKDLYYSGLIGNDGNLWAYVGASYMGLYCYDPSNDQLLHYNKGNSSVSLNSNVINNIVQGDNNTIWVGTDHGGINLIDAVTHKINYLVNRDDDPKSLSGNSVVLYKDNTGIIWAGTFKQGVSYFHKSIIQFPLIRHYIMDSSSLPYEDVDCFVEDANGNLWIGTNGGGLIFYDKKTKKYTQFKHDPENPNSLSNDIIISLYIDHEHKLWIGTYFGGLDRLDGDKFVNYRHKDNLPGSLSDDRVYSILEDSAKQLWIGTKALKI